MGCVNKSYIDESSDDGPFWVIDGLSETLSLVRFVARSCDGKI